MCNKNNHVDNSQTNGQDLVAFFPITMTTMTYSLLHFHYKNLYLHKIGLPFNVKAAAAAAAAGFGL